ncbi:hypothetical protein BLOT_013520 [Blomia tropicalis]|nr:hypothetical protein BLOT_013520 [Blomia tropicalis]
MKQDIEETTQAKGAMSSSLHITVIHISHNPQEKNKFIEIVNHVFGLIVDNLILIALNVSNPLDLDSPM